MDKPVSIERLGAITNIPLYFTGKKTFSQAVDTEKTTIHQCDTHKSGEHDNIV